ncbi:hypothetical protein [Nocardioides baekrokdamisoli]|nr:hypothetical protein [Nocardioides baekrokdamisoli]
MTAVSLTGCSAATPAGTPTVQESPSTADSAAPDLRADAARVLAQDQHSEEVAQHEATRLLASMPQPAGSHRVPGSKVPPLVQSTITLSGLDRSETATGFWLVPATTTHSLADWYTLNPPAGMTSDPHAIGGSMNSDRSQSDDVFYSGAATSSARDSAAIIEVAPVGAQMGVRITVLSSWRPARPAASYTPSDVAAVRIEALRDAHKHIVTVAVTDPAAIAQLRHAYDALSGTHALGHSCPVQLHPTEYQVTFISRTRQVVATMSPSCEPVWTVAANGTALEPALRDAAEFSTLVSKLTGTPAS